MQHPSACGSAVSFTLCIIMELAKVFCYTAIHSVTFSDYFSSFLRVGV